MRAVTASAGASVADSSSLESFGSSVDFVRQALSPIRVRSSTTETIDCFGRTVAAEMVGGSMVESLRVAAAAVEFVVNSVDRQIEDDLAAPDADAGSRPSEVTRTTANRITRRVATELSDGSRVEIVGHVSDQARIGIVAHSFDTGRRVTFYCGDESVRAIRTAADRAPEWIDANGPNAVEELARWITARTR